jgi:hypothetical protein
MALSSISVHITRLGLVGRIFFLFVAILCDDFDSKVLIWCSKFSGMVVDMKAGTGRNNMLSCYKKWLSRMMRVQTA